MKKTRILLCTSFVCFICQRTVCVIITAAPYWYSILFGVICSLVQLLQFTYIPKAWPQRWKMTYIRAYVFFLNTFINKLHNVPQISCRKWYFVFFFHLSVISSNNWIRNFLKKCIFLCFQSNTQYGNCRKVLSQSFRKNSVKSTHLVFYFALQLGSCFYEISVKWEWIFRFSTLCGTHTKL